MAELTCFYCAWFHFNQACGKSHTHTHTFTQRYCSVFLNHTAPSISILSDLTFNLKEREKKRARGWGWATQEKKEAQGKSGVRTEGGGENVIDRRRHGKTERDVTSIRSLSC